ncbi:MAG: hypothetical protein AUJ49_01800 [Desulfovibrionaceae bacterium CG1_02_65_16]|nr:MAG: hypothetical protein AUJ49_01800 [Desulfovibrionaceae bacterium CG1_02_65_16]
MTRSPLIERLAGIIGPALEPLSVTLWGVELASAGSRMVVRVYIDDAGDGSVSIDVCARASRALGAVFDAEDVLPGAYVLEVSSPGLERRFFSAAQMAAYVGRVVDVRLFEPQDGRRHLRGTLAEVKDELIGVDEEGVTTRVAFDRVKTAHLVHEFPEVGLGAK